MREPFRFKGISSESMGVVLSDKWIDTKAGINYESVEIEGRDGAILTPLNYKNVTKKVKATLLNKGKLNSVMAWLSGQGIFEKDGRYRMAYIFDEIEYEQYGVIKETFEIPFIFEPFWYKADTYTEYSQCVNNDGNMEAVPMIKLEGKGTVDITINNVRFAVSFDSSGSIEVDSKEKKEDKPQNISIGFEYPTLKPGRNEITIHTGSCKVLMKRKDRWLG